MVVERLRAAPSPFSEDPAERLMRGERGSAAREVSESGAKQFALRSALWMACVFGFCWHRVWSAVKKLKPLRALRATVGGKVSLSDKQLRSGMQNKQPEILRDYV